MKRYGLTKSKKLCSDTAIETLFRGGVGTFSAIAYPVRAVWRVDSPRRDGAADMRFLISVPKKRLRHAVDRVKMRRRMREAYRLGRESCAEGESRSVDLAFIYVGDRLTEYSRVSRSIAKLLDRVKQSLALDTQSDAVN